VTERVVILGAGTGGTSVANRLRRELAASTRIAVVDRDDHHVYQPGLLFVPFGSVGAGGLSRPRGAQLAPGIDFLVNPIDRVDVAASRVHLEDGAVLDYDVLVVATGAVLVPEETEGLVEALAAGRAFSFYTPEGATALATALDRFEEGRLVVDVVDMPIKCPVAPLEFCFLADWYLRRRGRRERVELTYATPLDGAFTQPVASATLGGLLADKDIEVVTGFACSRVDGAAGRLESYDGRDVGFDLAVVVPLHAGAPYVGRSEGLGDELNFVDVDPATLRSRAAPNVFALGDAAGVPTSKAGSVAHFEAEVVAENVRRVLAGEPPDANFDGHTNCFVETGHHKALLIDFNYDTEPLPGHFPGPVGLPLLKESRLNHLGKLLFEWIYWNGLLPGRDLPGISAAMPAGGKVRSVPMGASREG
jgi:sulfide:quinone oxidoreductase